MRATDLGFRSPKERTPDSYCPQVTNDGRYLSFSPRQIRGGLIGTEARFATYAVNNRKTGFRVGPGTYENWGSTDGRSAVAYRPLHLNKDTSSNGYYMVGNHLIYDAHWVSKKKNLPEPDLNCRVDVRSALSHTSEGKYMYGEDGGRPGTGERMSLRDEPLRSRPSTRRKTVTSARRPRQQHPPLLALRNPDIRKALETRLSL